jgi:hypothetical protein
MTGGEMKSIRLEETNPFVSSNGNGLAGLQVKINSFLVLETFSEDHATVQTLRLVERQLAGIMPLEISLEADSPGRFLEPDVFHRVASVTLVGDVGIGVRFP